MNGLHDAMKHMLAAILWTLAITGPVMLVAALTLLTPRSSLAGNVIFVGLIALDLCAITVWSLRRKRPLAPMSNDDDIDLAGQRVAGGFVPGLSHPVIAAKVRSDGSVARWLEVADAKKRSWIHPFGGARRIITRLDDLDEIARQRAGQSPLKF